MINPPKPTQTAEVHNADKKQVDKKQKEKKRVTNQINKRIDTASHYEFNVIPDKNENYSAMNDLSDAHEVLGIKGEKLMELGLKMGIDPELLSRQKNYASTDEEVIQYDYDRARKHVVQQGNYSEDWKGER